MRRGAAALLALWLATAGPARAAAVGDAAETPAVAGEVLDIALEHCRRGERAQALALLAAIRDQLDPPPAIRRLVEDLEASGCAPASAAATGGLRLQAGGGWDSNVSQGISARSLVLGSGETRLELPLDASYRPRPSAYAQLAADYGTRLPSLGLDLQWAAGARHNASAAAFDLVTLGAAAGRDFAFATGVLRAQLELSQVGLGGHAYLGGGAGTLQWLRPDAKGAWLVTARQTLSYYRTQPAQDARLRELGGLREQRLAAWASAHAGLTLQRDDARGLRPGGDRSGWQAQLGGVLLLSGWRVQPELSTTRWHSAQVFAPGVLEVVRRNRLHQVLLQAERPLAPGSSLLLEWRGRWARDSVPLYTYQDHVLGASLIRRF